jgi:hypothetical protein
LYPLMVIKSVDELPNAPAASDCKICVMGSIQKALCVDTVVNAGRQG